MTSVLCSRLPRHCQCHWSKSPILVHTVILLDTAASHTSFLQEHPFIRKSIVSFAAVRHTPNLPNTHCSGDSTHSVLVVVEEQRAAQPVSPHGGLLTRNTTSLVIRSLTIQTNIRAVLCVFVGSCCGVSVPRKDIIKYSVPIRRRNERKFSKQELLSCSCDEGSMLKKCVTQNTHTTSGKSLVARSGSFWRESSNELV